MMARVHFLRDRVVLITFTGIPEKTTVSTGQNGLGCRRFANTPFVTNLHLNWIEVKSILERYVLRIG